MAATVLRASYGTGNLLTITGNATDSVYEGDETFIVTLSNPTSGTTIGPIVNGDTIVEPDEAFFLLLEDASSGNIAGPIATAVILDDDEPHSARDRRRCGGHARHARLVLPHRAPSLQPDRPADSRADRAAS